MCSKSGVDLVFQIHITTLMDIILPWQNDTHREREREYRGEPRGERRCERERDLDLCLMHLLNGVDL
jgi:hypothetical protein